MSSSYFPERPEDTLWDAVVVGTGMGGSTVGYGLARLGRKVLFLEKGLFLFGDHDRGQGQMVEDPDDSPAGRLARGWWPEKFQGKTTFGQQDFFAPVGCGTGGGAALYAAQLERLEPCDFRPRANFRHCPDSTLPEAWPIQYEDLLPYYRRAEQLYRVCGTPDPLHPDPELQLRSPPPLSPRDAELFTSLERAGLHPYRAHVGFAFLPGCTECGATLCPRECKSDAGRICMLPALKEHGAKVLAECEVTRFEADADAVRFVHCQQRGRSLRIPARTVFVAAGAFRSPVLLLNSTSQEWPQGLANGSGLVGRNLMLHAGDFIAVRPRQERSGNGPLKAMAFNDFYLADGVKMGTVQSVGIEINRPAVMTFVSSMLSKLGPPGKALRPFGKVAAQIGAMMFKNASVLATIVEDLPYHENRVFPDASSSNGLRFEYRYTEDLKRRNRILRKRIAEALKPYHHTLRITGANNVNYGHVCGTVRAGDDPATSVLDRDCRAHDVENLYVVDASWFPSSGGTNPTLTIAANALRVADAVHARLGAEAH